MNNIDKTILALTMYGEARGEIALVGDSGVRAVALVVLNRLNHGGFGKTITQICHKPFQFSCWNPSDPNYCALTCPLTQETDVFKMCLESLNALHHDFTKGATHYHATRITPPYWTTSMTQTLTLGRHVFYA